MEINHLLDVDEFNVIVVYDKDEAKAKLAHWLDTPKGTRWGDSSWGHRLEQFKHEPPSSSVEVAMENIIFKDIREDLPMISIKGILISLTNKDVFEIIISTHYGLISQTINR